MKKDEFCSAIAKPISMNCIKRKIEARKVRWYRKMMNYVFKIMSYSLKMMNYVFKIMSYSLNMMNYV